MSLVHLFARILGAAVSSLVATTAIAGAARIEVHPVETMDIPTTEFLRGAASGPTRIVAAELRLPTTSAPKVPAVVFLHGDAGAIGNQPPWIDALVAMGIAVLTVDSFSGRGAISGSPRTEPIDGTPGAATRVVDAYRALALLSRHPRIDASRIALIGISSGGRTTILSAMKRFSTPFAPAGARFAAYVALYPPCNAKLVDDERLEAGPLRIYIGAADDVTRADACERYVARLRRAGVDAAVTVYPGAFHGFDNVPGTAMTRADGVPGFGACTFEERDARLVNVDTGSPPAMSDACVTKGFTAGRDAAADGAVRKAVADLLRGVLRPEP